MLWKICQYYEINNVINCLTTISDVTRVFNAHFDKSILIFRKGKFLIFFYSFECFFSNVNNIIKTVKNLVISINFDNLQLFNFNIDVDYLLYILS